MVSHATYLPEYDRLKVPHEIVLSTPSMKAAGPYMNMYCEGQCKEFMLCRKEERDPRKCLAEGAAVTACGIKFLRQVKNKCRSEFENYAHCIDRGNSNVTVSPCYETRRPWDECIRDNFGMHKAEIGYFVRPHVHSTERAKPEIDLRQPRDYAAEAKAMMHELPADMKLTDKPRLHDSIGFDGLN